MVAHPQTRFVAFTGSKKVGLEIHESAAKTQPGQRFIKRTILEMGGKGRHYRGRGLRYRPGCRGRCGECVGFNGQKCSACSRAIVDQDIYDVFCDRVQERVEKIRQGDPAENYYAGPVISPVAYKRVLDYIEIGKGEGRLLNGGAAVETAAGGYYVAPTVFADVLAGARIAQEEIFGPVLAIIKSSSFDESLEIANGTEYGLTGAIYSSSREKLERAKTEFQVGNCI